MAYDLFSQDEVDAARANLASDAEQYLTPLQQRVPTLRDKKMEELFKAKQAKLAALSNERPEDSAENTLAGFAGAGTKLVSGMVGSVASGIENIGDELQYDPNQMQYDKLGRAIGTRAENGQTMEDIPLASTFNDLGQAVSKAGKEGREFWNDNANLANDYYGYVDTNVEQKAAAGENLKNTFVNIMDLEGGKALESAKAFVDNATDMNIMELFAQSLPEMAASVHPATMVPLIMSKTEESIQEYMKDNSGQEPSAGRAAAIAASATAYAYLNKLGVEKAITPGAVTAITSTIKPLTADLTGNAFANFVKDGIIVPGGRLLAAGVVEGVTEPAQDLSLILGRELFTEKYGEKSGMEQFSTLLKEHDKQLWEAAATGGILGVAIRANTATPLEAAAGVNRLRTGRASVDQVERTVNEASSRIKKGAEDKVKSDQERADANTKIQESAINDAIKLDELQKQVEQDIETNDQSDTALNENAKRRQQLADLQDKVDNNTQGPIEEVELNETARKAQNAHMTAMKNLMNKDKELAAILEKEANAKTLQEQVELRKQKRAILTDFHKLSKQVKASAKLFKSSAPKKANIYDITKKAQATNSVEAEAAAVAKAEAAKREAETAEPEVTNEDYVDGLTKEDSKLTPEDNTFIFSQSKNQYKVDKEDTPQEQVTNSSTIFDNIIETVKSMETIPLSDTEITTIQDAFSQSSLKGKLKETNNLLKVIQQVVAANPDKYRDNASLKKLDSLLTKTSYSKVKESAEQTKAKEQEQTEAEFAYEQELAEEVASTKPVETEATPRENIAERLNERSILSEYEKMLQHNQNTSTIKVGDSDLKHVTSNEFDFQPVNATHLEGTSLEGGTVVEHTAKARSYNKGYMLVGLTQVDKDGTTYYVSNNATRSNPIVMYNADFKVLNSDLTPNTKFSSPIIDAKFDDIYQSSKSVAPETNPDELFTKDPDQVRILSPISELNKLIDVAKETLDTINKGNLQENPWLADEDAVAAYIENPDSFVGSTEGKITPQAIESAKRIKNLVKAKVARDSNEHFIGKDSNKGSYYNQEKDLFSKNDPDAKARFFNHYTENFLHGQKVTRKMENDINAAYDQLQTLQSRFTEGVDLAKEKQDVVATLAKQSNDGASINLVNLFADAHTGFDAEFLAAASVAVIKEAASLSTKKAVETDITKKFKKGNSKVDNIQADPKNKSLNTKYAQAVGNTIMNLMNLSVNPEKYSQNQIENLTTGLGLLAENISMSKASNQQVILRNADEIHTYDTFRRFLDTDAGGVMFAMLNDFTTGEDVMPNVHEAGATVSPAFSKAALGIDSSSAKGFSVVEAVNQGKAVLDASGRYDVDTEVMSLLNTLEGYKAPENEFSAREHMLGMKETKDEQATTVEGTIANNNSIARTMSKNMKFIDALAKGATYTMNHAAMVNSRLKNKMTVMNVINDKNARGMSSFHKKSVVKIDGKHGKNHDNFRRSILWSTGAKIHKMSNKKVSNQDNATTVLAAFEALLKPDSEVMGHANTVRKLTEGTKATPEEVAALTKFTNSEERLFTLRGLRDLNQYIDAQNAGKKQITTNATLEIDGVTNGVGITSMQVGTDYPALETIYQITGTYPKTGEQPYLNIEDFFARNPGTKDIYERSSEATEKAINDLLIESEAKNKANQEDSTQPKGRPFHILKFIMNDKNDVDGKKLLGRNFFKWITMQDNYGQQETGLRKSFANGYISTYLEEHADTKFRNAFSKALLDTLDYKIRQESKDWKGHIVTPKMYSIKNPKLKNLLKTREAIIAFNSGKQTTMKWNKKTKGYTKVSQSIKPQDVLFNTFQLDTMRDLLVEEVGGVAVTALKGVTQPLSQYSEMSSNVADHMFKSYTMAISVLPAEDVIPNLFNTLDQYYGKSTTGKAVNWKHAKNSKKEAFTLEDVFNKAKSDLTKAQYQDLLLRREIKEMLPLIGTYMSEDLEQDSMMYKSGKLQKINFKGNVENDTRTVLSASRSTTGIIESIQDMARESRFKSAAKAQIVIQNGLMSGPLGILKLDSALMSEAARNAYFRDPENFVMSQVYDGAFSNLDNIETIGQEYNKAFYRLPLTFSIMGAMETSLDNSSELMARMIKSMGVPRFIQFAESQAELEAKSFADQNGFTFAAKDLKLAVAENKIRWINKAMSDSNSKGVNKALEQALIAIPENAGNEFRWNLDGTTLKARLQKEVTGQRNNMLNLAQGTSSNLGGSNAVSVNTIINNKGITEVANSLVSNPNLTNKDQAEASQLVELLEALQSGRIYKGDKEVSVRLITDQTLTLLDELYTKNKVKAKGEGFAGETKQVIEGFKDNNTKGAFIPRNEDSYSDQEGDIYIKEDFRGSTPLSLLKTLVHETVHSKVDILLDTDGQFVDRINSVIDSVRNVQYGASTIGSTFKGFDTKETRAKEFMAELFENVALQNALLEAEGRHSMTDVESNLGSGATGFQAVWKKVIQALISATRKLMASNDTKTKNKMADVYMEMSNAIGRRGNNFFDPNDGSKTTSKSQESRDATTEFLDSQKGDGTGSTFQNISQTIKKVTPGKDTKVVKAITTSADFMLEQLHSLTKSKLGKKVFAIDLGYGDATTVEDLGKLLNHSNKGQHAATSLGSKATEVIDEILKNYSFTKEENATITAGILDADMAAIVSNEASVLDRIVADKFNKATIEKEIANLYTRVGGDTKALTKEVELLSNYMMNDIRDPEVKFNAKLIAKKLEMSNVRDIDTIISLSNLMKADTKALAKISPDHMTEIMEFTVAHHEHNKFNMARKEEYKLKYGPKVGGVAIPYLAKQFSDDSLMERKGYLRQEFTEPVEFKVLTDKVELARILASNDGWKVYSPKGADTMLVYRRDLRLATQEGIVHYQDSASRGTNMLEPKDLGGKKLETAMTKKYGKDWKTKYKNALPLYDRKGKKVNYRIEMSKEDKINLLGLQRDFGSALGHSTANTIRSVHNTKLVLDVVERLMGTNIEEEPVLLSMTEKDFRAHKSDTLKKKYVRINTNALPASMKGLKVNYVLEEVSDQLLGYKEASVTSIIGDVRSARIAEKVVKESVAQFKSWAAVTNPVVQLGNAISNRTIAILLDIPIEEQRKDFVEGRTLLGEYDKLEDQYRKMYLKYRGSQGTTQATYKKQLDAIKVKLDKNIISKLAPEGFVQAIVDDINKDHTGKQTLSEEGIKKLFAYTIEGSGSSAEARAAINKLLTETLKFSGTKAARFTKAIGTGIDTMSKVTGRDLFGNQDVTNIAAKIDEVIAKDPNLSSMIKEALMMRGSAAERAMGNMMRTNDFLSRYSAYQDGIRKGMTHDVSVKRALDSFIDYRKRLPKELQALNDFGVVPFITFMVRGQKPLVKAVLDNPAKMLAIFTLGKLVGMNDIVRTDGWFITNTTLPEVLSGNVLRLDPTENIIGPTYADNILDAMTGDVDDLAKLVGVSFK